MLAMLQHPEVQERARAEIDAVVGTNRLPNFNDRPNLPYVEAILMETLRKYAVAPLGEYFNDDACINPQVPLGIPHATTADNIYDDIFIPKGNDIMSP